MKMTKEHFEFIEKRVKKVIKENPNYYKMYKESGLSDMRYRWDMLHMAGCLTFTCQTLYKYLNDDHIDTALRKITKTS